LNIQYVYYDLLTFKKVIITIESKKIEQKETKNIINKKEEQTNGLCCLFCVSFCRLKGAMIQGKENIKENKIIFYK